MIFPARLVLSMAAPTGSHRRLRDRYADKIHKNLSLARAFQVGLALGHDETVLLFIRLGVRRALCVCARACVRVCVYA